MFEFSQAEMAIIWIVFFGKLNFVWQKKEITFAESLTIEASISIRSIPAVLFLKVGGSWNVDDFASYEHGFLTTPILTLDMWKLKYDMNLQVEKMITSLKH